MGIKILLALAGSYYHYETLQLESLLAIHGLSKEFPMTQKINTTIIGSNLPLTSVGFFNLSETIIKLNGVCNKRDDPLSLKKIDRLLVAFIVTIN